MLHLARRLFEPLLLGHAVREVVAEGAFAAQAIDDAHEAVGVVITIHRVLAERVGFEHLVVIYNVKRIHSSLGYLTPREFEARWREQQGRALTMETVTEDRATVGTDLSAAAGPSPIGAAGGRSELSAGRESDQSNSAPSETDKTVNRWSSFGGVLRSEISTEATKLALKPVDGMKRTSGVDHGKDAVARVLAGQNPRFHSG